MPTVCVVVFLRESKNKQRLTHSMSDFLTHLSHLKGSVFKATWSIREYSLLLCQFPCGIPKKLFTDANVCRLVRLVILQFCYV